jgi:hypothetical protein
MKAMNNIRTIGCWINLGNKEVYAAAAVGTAGALLAYIEVDVPWEEADDLVMGMGEEGYRRAIERTAHDALWESLLRSKCAA